MNQYKTSNVRWRKVLENYRNNYNFNDEWEIAVLELIANSIDAKADRINIEFSQKENKIIDIICEDNGKGMNKKEFEDYHNLGSLSKDKSPKTIGFAGIGAKLCLDLCDRVYTETSNGSEKLASVWHFSEEEDAPRYKFVEPENMLSFKTGTFVKVEGLRVREFTLDRAKGLIMDNYKYILKPIGTIFLQINNYPLSPQKPKVDGESIKSKPFSFKSKSKELVLNISGEIYIFDFDRKRIRGQKNFGIDIDVVICGKTVVKGENFGLEVNINPRYAITGYVICNELIHVVKTSKDGVNKQSKLWREFQKVFSLWLEDYLKKENVWIELKQRDLETYVALQIIAEKLNSVVYQFPELSELFSKIKKKTLIEDPTGEISGRLSEHSQLVTGTIGGLGRGSIENIPTSGFEKTEGIEKGEEKRAVEKTKKVRGLKISVDDVKNSKERVIFRPHDSLFILNSSHPAYRLSEKYGDFYIYVIHVILEAIAKYAEGQIELNESAEEFLWRLYDEVLKRME